MFRIEKKNNLAFGLSRRLGNKFLNPLKGKYEYCMFLSELFSLDKKVPSALGHAGFFSKYFIAKHPLEPK